MDEYEVICLVDDKKFYQEEAATHVNISQQVFDRIIEATHRKQLVFLINGKALKVEGGGAPFDEEKSCSSKKDRRTEKDTPISGSDV